MFADEGCTQYYDGSETDKVYVRINRDFAIDETLSIGNGDNTRLYIGTPSTEIPSDPYMVTAYVDFQSADMSSLVAGQVVVCSYSQEGLGTVSDPVTIFYES